MQTKGAVSELLSFPPVRSKCPYNAQTGSGHSSHCLSVHSLEMASRRSLFRAHHHASVPHPETWEESLITPEVISLPLQLQYVLCVKYSILEPLPLQVPKETSVFDKLCKATEQKMHYIKWYYTILYYSLYQCYPMKLSVMMRMFYICSM